MWQKVGGGNEVLVENPKRVESRLPLLKAKKPPDGAVKCKMG